MVGTVKKDWFALGLILIISGLVLVSLSNTISDQSNYVLRSSVDNIRNMNLGSPIQVSVTAYFNADQHFCFNFTSGRYWGDEDDQYDPANMNFAPNNSIDPYKTLGFYIYTPSGDVVSSEVFVVYGTEPYAVVYLNQSTDFIPLAGGNLSLGVARMEGQTTRAGNFTFVVTAIDPYVEHLSATDLYDVVAHGRIGADPPRQMYLYNIDTVATKPYFPLFLIVGPLLVIVGAVPFVWAARPKKKHSHRPVKANSQ